LSPERGRLGNFSASLDAVDKNCREPIELVVHLDRTKTADIDLLGRGNIALDEAQFLLLFDAFFAEIQHKFT
jgi:hypothetical protein